MINEQYRKCSEKRSSIRCDVKVFVRRLLADSAVRSTWTGRRRLWAASAATWWVACIISTNHRTRSAGRWRLALWTCSLQTAHSSNCAQIHRG